MSALRPLETGYLCGTFTRQDEQTKQLKLPGKTVWPCALSALGLAESEQPPSTIILLGKQLTLTTLGHFPY